MWTGLRDTTGFNMDHSVFFHMKLQLYLRNIQKIEAKITLRKVQRSLTFGVAVWTDGMVSEPNFVSFASSVNNKV